MSDELKIETPIEVDWIKRPRGLGVAYVVAHIVTFLALGVIAYFVGSILRGRP